MSRVLYTKKSDRLTAWGRPDILFTPPSANTFGQILGVQGIALDDPTPDVVRPPRGPTVEWWEDWFVGGMTVQQVFDAIGASRPNTTRVTISMPSGTFNMSDFPLNSGGNIYSTKIPVNCNLWGSGSSGPNATIFRIVPDSSTKGPVIPQKGSGLTNQYNMMGIQNVSSVNATGGTFKNFAMLCTPQRDLNGSLTPGHEYNGFRLQHVPNGIMENVYIEGAVGTAAAPPGETFGLNVYLSDGFTVRNVEINGIRTRQGLADGPGLNGSCASSPIGSNNSNNCFVYDSYFHDCYQGMPTCWQSDGWQTFDVKSWNNRCGWNHERVRTVKHTRMNIKIPGRPHHYTLMNDQFDSTGMFIIDPVWTPGTGSATKLVIQCGPRGTGIVDMQTSNPSVTRNGISIVPAEVLIAGN